MFSIELSNGMRLVATLDLLTAALVVKAVSIESGLTVATVPIPLKDLRRLGLEVAALIKAFRS